MCLYQITLLVCEELAFLAHRPQTTNNSYKQKTRAQKTRISIGTSKPENDKRFNATTRKNLRLTGLNLVVK